MFRLSLFVASLFLLSGCGSAKREGPNFRESRRPTELLQCFEGKFVDALIDGESVGGAMMDIESDFVQLSFSISHIGELATEFYYMLLPDDMSQFLSTNFVAYEWGLNEVGEWETGEIFGDMFNLDNGYWAMVQGFDELMQSRADEGYGPTSFALGNNSIVYLFTSFTDPSDTKEETLAIIFYVSTMVNSDNFGDELSILDPPCSHNPFPWELNN